MTAPEFVVVGHAVRDIVPDGWRLGGTITFAAAQAHRLGWSVGVMTCAASDLDVAAELPFAQVLQAPSPRTTQFENVYVDGKRRQRVLSRADAIAPEDVPDSWAAASVVLLGPVLDEVPARLRERFERQSLVGVSAQGWLRRVGADGQVLHAAWEGEPFWSGCDVVFVSDEDLPGGDDSLVTRWTREMPVVVMTEAWRGARIWAEGSWRRIDAFPERDVDPTGAGDTFATAFLIRMREKATIDDAARFAAAAASLSVAGIGRETIASREEIEARLARFPEVALR